jgi:hypothetical protein
MTLGSDNNGARSGKAERVRGGFAVRITRLCTLVPAELCFQLECCLIIPMSIYCCNHCCGLEENDDDICS